MNILSRRRPVVALRDSLSACSYVCEIAPPNRRGQLASVVQVFVTIGLCLGYFVCYGTVRIPSSLSWRLPLALHSTIAVCLAFCSFFLLSESPRWLAFKGRKEEASRAWDKLGVSEAEREKDLLLNPTTMNDTPAAPTQTNKLGFFAKMRRDLIESMAMFSEGSRRPMLLGVFMMSMQQFSGIDGVIYVRISSVYLSSSSNVLLVCLHR